MIANFENSNNDYLKLTFDIDYNYIWQTWRGDNSMLITKNLNLT